MPNCRGASFPCRHRHLHPVRRGGAHLRDRLVAPARARLREHDAGGLSDPHWVLRRDGDRRSTRWPDRRSGPLTAALLRTPRDRPRGGRARHAAHVPADRRSLSRHLSVTRGDALAGHRAPRPRGPGARTGDDHDGRHVPGPGPPLHQIGGARPGVRAALFGQYARRRGGHVDRRHRAHRALRSERRAADRGDVLGHRRDRGPVAGPWRSRTSRRPRRRIR